MTTERIATKCMNCSLHFNIYSWEPGKHTAKTIYCPECGEHNGAFLIWRAEEQNQIFEFVPGGASFGGFKNKKDETYNIGDRVSFRIGPKAHQAIVKNIINPQLVEIKTDLVEELVEISTDELTKIEKENNEQQLG